MGESLPAGPFGDAARYYDAFRPPYAPEALEYVAKTFGLDAGSRVLDLGCGPGTIAIPLSRTGADVTAVDLDPAMLDEARRLAAERGAGQIEWIHGRAEDVLAGIGRFHLVTLGQSLHWMDRDLVLERLGQVVEDGGGLVILDEGQRRPQESWEAAAMQVVARHLGPRTRNASKHPEVAHTPSLKRSAHFSQFTVREFGAALTRDPASILGYLYSCVGASRPLFGEGIAEFEAELFDTLRQINPSGVFHEQVETAVIVAMKARRG
ncbi:MAG TPA: class I SAM-dependent methyltransferase [Phenylobacterium sp.]